VKSPTPEYPTFLLGFAQLLDESPAFAGTPQTDKWMGRQKPVKPLAQPHRIINHTHLTANIVASASEV
jgi:hypothetical protein